MWPFGSSYADDNVKQTESGLHVENVRNDRPAFKRQVAGAEDCRPGRARGEEADSFSLALLSNPPDMSAASRHASRKNRALREKTRIRAQRAQEMVEMIAKIDRHDRAWLSLEKGSRLRSTVSLS